MLYEERVNMIRKKMVELRKNDDDNSLVSRWVRSNDCFVAMDGYTEWIIYGNSGLGSDNISHIIAFYFQNIPGPYDFWYNKSKKFVESLEIGEIKVFGIRGNRKFLVGRV